MVLLRLHSADTSLAISPQHGGGIVSFEAFGEQILAPAPDPIKASTDPSAFVLLPYCNRIAHGSAQFAGRSIRLTPPFTGERHALHGEGWVAEWEIESSTSASAELSFCHKPCDGKWPWSFNATQHYELTGNRLAHRLRIQNISADPMPAGLGFHPYFPLGPDYHFEANVDGIWKAGENLLPVERIKVQRQEFWPGGKLRRGEGLDNCFTGWDGKLTIKREEIHVTLIASKELGLLHIYAPEGADFFCAEPVSHMPDALNQGGGEHQMRTLLPGDCLEASITYLIEKAA